RAYAPWVDMEAELRARGLPLVSHESARPLRDFDVVGLSLQFELTYTNCLNILELGGIPLRSSDRGDDDPLVLGGGPNATHPEPVAPFFDAFVIGDGEESCTRVALAWARGKRAGIPRAERLAELAQLPGVYVPSLYEVKEDPTTGLQVVSGVKRSGVPRRVQRSLVANLNDYPFPAESPVGGPEAIFDRMSIEIARGCTEGCRFCQAGMIYRPVRERDPEQIVATVVEAVKRTGQDEVSLTSLSTADASCIAPLIKKVVERLEPERVALGVSSLRAYGLSDELLDELQRVRATGLTFAPEAGTQRMRDVINKNITEEQLLDTAQRVFSKGWDRMKLYFMIGLPTEQDEDIRGIVETGRRALDAGKEAMKKAGKGRSLGRASVTVSVSTHVPKPHTPFQWCAMDTLEEIERKQQLLRETARALRIDLKTHNARESILEGIFARGDRRLADVIEEAFRNGARFDSWEEHLKLDIWHAAFQKFGVDVGRYLGTLPVNGRLPWDHIDIGLEDGFLAREYRRALQSRLSPPCGKAVGMFVHHTNVADARADTRRLVCYDCGVACDMTQMRQERIDFLTRMGADTPDALRRLPMLPPTPVADQDDVPPPAHAPRKEVHRYRIAYEKLGPVAFLGHLDLVRELPRVLRRIEVPMAYTEGFHPKPDMTFGPALSLGVPSLAEYIDFKLLAEYDIPSLLARMNAAAPEGLRFTAAAKLSPFDPGITKVISGARYALVYARSALPPRGEVWLRERTAALLAADTLPVTRVIDQQSKQVDVRAYLRTIKVGSEAAQRAAARAGLVGDLVAVEVEVAITGSGAVKSSEVAEVLSGSDVYCRTIRMELLADGGRSPLAIVGRTAPPKKALPAEAAEANTEA
ncbi:MAG: TIGR03960 family B12-binding radical SAM protein, partial [Myxococcales bacterium]|nr:TIGR03960 family B12-binding radical SAM protein [Polyangiaceae bacterium]MDW8250249.1 TIGR03960 family B12-binding radical SAM protein [Myxococcales bacterium]